MTLKGSTEQIFSANESNSSLAAVLVLTAVAVFSWCIREVPASVSAYIIGVSGLAGLGFAVWLKHRGRWSLNAEVIFLGGISIQYLLAPVLLRLATKNLDDFKLVDIDITAERMEVHGAHAGGMCLVLMYVAAFFLGAHFFRNPKLPREKDGTFQTKFTQGSLWLAGVLVVVLWLTRIILLKTGSYYHLERSDFQFEDPRYSMLAQIDVILGPIVSTYFFGRCLLRRDALFVPGIALIAGDCAWNFVSGSRERALLACLTLVVGYMLIRKRISMRMLIPVCVAGVLMIGFMDYYRYALRESNSASEINAGRVFDAFMTAKSKSETVGLEQTVVSALARLSDLDSIAAVYAWVPQVVDYLGGETYSKILFLPVPRALYPEKPQMILPINGWFFVNEGGSSPTTIIGEAFLNFGWLGVCVIGVASALLLRGSERFLCRNWENPMFLPTYVSFLLNVSRIHTEPAAVWIGFMSKYCLFLLAAHLILKIIDVRQKARDPETPPSLACAPGN